MEFDWTNFTIKTLILEDPQTVFNFWIKPELLELWFLRSADFIRKGKPLSKKEMILPGDKYKWLWHGYPDNVLETGEIITQNYKDLLVFSFGETGTVEVKIEPFEKKSLLYLRQFDIPPYNGTVNYHVECKTGWTYYLANLQSVVLGGPDLRNKNQNLHLD